MDSTRGLTKRFFAGSGRRDLSEAGVPQLNFDDHEGPQRSGASGRPAGCCRRPWPAGVRALLRGYAISLAGSILVRIWFVFPGPRTNWPYSQESGRLQSSIAVIDNDGQVEIVVTHNNLIESAHGVTVVGDMDQSWRPGRKIWNQHAYNITNSIRVS